MNLNTSEYNAFYQVYIDKTNKELSIIEGLKQQLDAVVLFYLSIAEEKHNYAYAEGKWSVKDVLLHIIDTERILAYRAMRIARQDKTPLVGFEQDDYVQHGFAKKRSMESLIEEYKSVRFATITLFASLNADALFSIGEASGFPISVRALGYIILGHEQHHNLIIKARYL
ncbi:DinB family protein [Winogradskyella wichelsiae]|uniref:DinB family protein n=1 Tax=Winogradskyella wichelsiae TaxID=2697007 RepID=UPI0015CB87D8|nr:DinB family protein [Winogradskyella wichelsiae]